MYITINVVLDTKSSIFLYGYENVNLYSFEYVYTNDFAYQCVYINACMYVGMRLTE